MTEPTPSRAKPAAPGDKSSAGAEQRLLALIRELAEELHPGRAARLRLNLKSRLDRDIGLDSLGRAELVLRIEKAFQVNLPETLMAEAETPTDLLQALLAAGPRSASVRPTQGLAPLEAGAGTPDEAETLIEALDWHVAAHPERRHIVLSHGTGDEQAITYRELAHRARQVARGLQDWGLEPGERAAIMLPTSEEFFYAFFGILYAGGVPVPIYPPMRLSQVEDHLRRQAVILNNCEAAILVTVPEARRLAQLLRGQVASLRGVETISALSSAAAPSPIHRAKDDIAFLQYTSGSTGDPKGVVLTHANLLANIRAMGESLEVESDEVFISWLPLYHDMGLIGAWLATLYFAVPTVIMSPLLFLTRPANWLWAIHRHKGTLSAGPNFAYELCLNKIADEDIEGLDLSSLRMVANGAEPISPATLRRFAERFAPYGLQSTAMTPVYGLAESSVGLAFPPPGRGPLIDRIDREALTRHGEARPAAADDGNALELVACGRALAGHEMRIVDDTGREVPDRHEGRLQFRGPSATSGYFNNPERTKALFDGNWLETGDLAYMAGGDVFFTGRVKDMIIRAGRNIYPAEIESAVGDIEGIRKGCVAVFGSPDRRTGTERVIVLAETRETDEARLAAIRDAVMDVATLLLDGSPDDVILAPPHSVPKTSSGKIRRSSAREIFEAGTIGARPLAAWRQLLRLGLAGTRPAARRMARATVASAWALWFWIVVVGVACIVWPTVVLSPSRRAAWRCLRLGARSIFALSGLSFRVVGGQNWRDAPGLVVANHASYVDGLALTAAIPGELAFVAKKELADQRIAGPFLRRLGALFVERFDTTEAAAGKEELKHAAASGDRLTIFPEGTLTRVPGLMAFHLGGFLVAAEAGLPIAPIALRGTRSVLRGDQWFPRRGAIEVEICPPVTPDGDDWNAAIRLRDAARAAILERCGEPDLARERVLF